MTLIDYLVFGLYILGTLAVGLYYYRRNKSSKDMFSASGNSPWWVSGLSGFMTLKSAGTFVVWGGLAYSQGVVAVAINTCIAFSGILVGFLVAGQWRKIGVDTPAEFIALRFGQGAVQFYTWGMMAIRTLSTGVALYAVAVMLVALIPLPEGSFLRDAHTGQLSLGFTITLFGAIIILYTVSGGLWAVLMTDVVQFIVLQLAVLFVIPLLAFKVMSHPAPIALPAGFFSPLSAEYSLPFMVGWVAVHFFIIGAEWAFAQRYICVPTAQDARKSAWLFGGLYLISPAIWLAPPLLYRLLEPAARPEEAYILASRLVLPAGMLGLMMAAMFSATASAVSGQINVFAGVLTEQFYRRLRPSADEASLLWAGRVFTALLGLALVLVALAVPRLGGAKQIVLTLTGLLLGPLLAPTIWGLLGGRITKAAVYVSAGVSFAVGLIFKFALVGAMARWSAVAWVHANPRMSDVIFGAALPSLILAVFHFTARQDAPGWSEISRRLDAYRPAPTDITSGDHSPGEITWITLAATGLIMLALTLINPTGRVALCAFSAILLLLAALIRHAAASPSGQGDKRAKVQRR